MKEVKAIFGKKGEILVKKWKEIKGSNSLMKGEGAPFTEALIIFYQYFCDIFGFWEKLSYNKTIDWNEEFKMKEYNKSVKLEHVHMIFVAQSSKKLCVCEQ